MQQTLFEAAGVAAPAGQHAHEPSYGTDSKALARREDPATSRAAGDKVDTTRLEAMVHRAIHARGDNGCIAQDLLDQFLGNYAYSSITARFSALERKGFISCGPDKREGASGRAQRVMRSLKTPAE